uniref:Uncharacterized protein n=1 Tax=Ralstonia solanacearum CFBP2957 TaxID=859656 RepID=D8P647_RALSL|nr:protein of unknown function [Ralstonia solanacearum CFBP2957]
MKNEKRSSTGGRSSFVVEGTHEEEAR